MPDTVEIRGHPWFIGVQFHPELKSKPFDPHPLFPDFVRAAVEHVHIPEHPVARSNDIRSGIPEYPVTLM